MITDKEKQELLKQDLLNQLQPYFLFGSYQLAFNRVKLDYNLQGKNFVQLFYEKDTKALQDLLDYIEKY